MSALVIQVPIADLLKTGAPATPTNILDGDYVVIEQRDSARNGEIVVALVNNEEATLKRIEQQPGRVILHPANASLTPLVYSPDEVQIQGVLRGLLRSYR